MAFTYSHRDISWLKFNGRVLQQAADEDMPLLERFRFLAIFSANLDEFYRVRMPLLRSTAGKKDADGIVTATNAEVLEEARQIIAHQQRQFGTLLRNHLLPAAEAAGVRLYYNEPIPSELLPQLHDSFYHHLLPYLSWHYLDHYRKQFHPMNNQQYLLVALQPANGPVRLALVAINYPETGRLIALPPSEDGITPVLFADEVIRCFLPHLLGHDSIVYACAIKVTNDAELDVDGDLRLNDFESLTQKIRKRELGKVSRILYDPAIPKPHIDLLATLIGAPTDALVAGGQYHHLRDLAAMPLGHLPDMVFPAMPTLPDPVTQSNYFDWLTERDRCFHFPYHNYEHLLRFFSEAATDAWVESISVTIYRIAAGSRLVQALMTAARNGKIVTVFVEVKARFDELNNLYWAGQMKDAGIKIIYSIPDWKVHAKVALVTRRQHALLQHYGLLATGNFNETTASYYTDHAFLTTDPNLTRELDLLFAGLSLRTAPKAWPVTQAFRHLLVAPFNIRDIFYRLIEQEIINQQEGKAAGIFIKINNLEDQAIISKLYEASNAGVPIRMLVRGICCLVPGVPGQSEHITVRRIVDRYLEHARLFRFHNNGQPLWYAGSADWMQRNLEHRIEVCFPLTDPAIVAELNGLMQVQWPEQFTDTYAHSLQLAAYRYLSGDT